jgi:hypothetical protein
LEQRRRSIGADVLTFLFTKSPKTSPPLLQIASKKVSYWG